MNRAPLEIGLVNNMSGAAFHTTTKQFWSLLEEAAQGADIRLRVFSPFADPRVLSRSRTFLKNHEPLENLWASKPDGMIVTGTEPRAVRLTDEPCWPFLARLVDWSEDNVLSTVWSCLATQAAVFHLDRIERQALDTKLSGVFDCEAGEAHEVLNGYPDRWTVAHSRYNDLPERLLAAHGYRILVRSTAAGVDTFMKRRKSLHFFLQGHMEYDANALAREYRRDVRRFLAAESDRFPETPVACFREDVEIALGDFRARALRNRDIRLLDEIPVRIPAKSKKGPWWPVAIKFYRNWLACLTTTKTSGVVKTVGDMRGSRRATLVRF